MTPIFILAGAPAVGKSSTAEALAVQFEKSIHISVDKIREMVVSGLIHPGSEWGQELIEQLSLARESVTQMAMTYSRAGFVVVIDDFWDPNSRLLEYSRLFQGSNVHKVLLFPSQQAAEARNLNRNGPGDGSKYIGEGIRIVYDHLKKGVLDLEQQGWIIVDTTDKPIDAAVRHILAQVGGI